MDTIRFTIGFLIAPLAIPVIEFRAWERPALPAELLWLVFLSVIVAYAGTFLFGIPAYCLLRARKWTAFWFAPLAGFIVAGLTWWLLGILHALARRQWRPRCPQPSALASRRVVALIVALLIAPLAIPVIAFRQLLPLRACLGPQSAARRLVALRSSRRPCRHPAMAHCATRSSGEG